MTEQIANGEVTITQSGNADGQQLACLGGLPSGRTNLVPQDCAIYAALPRPARLPLPSFRVRKVNKEARFAYMQIWDGNCRIQWNNSADVNSLHLQASPLSGGGVADRFVDDGPVISSFLAFKVRTGDILMQVEVPSTEFGAAFTEDDNGALSNRVVYHFLRSHGALLTMRNPLMCRRVCRYLASQCKEDMKSRLDISILNCDLFMNNKRDAMAIGEAQTAVGEALEALGEFHKGALLYQHTAETYFTPTRSLFHHARLLEYSALAFKRCNLLEEAEEGYIRALHYRRLWASSIGDVWNLNELYTRNLLGNMLVFIEDIWAVKGRRIVEVGTEEIYPVFQAILYVAGFRPDPEHKSYYLAPRGQQFTSVLREDIRQSKQCALASLVEATAQPDKNHFFTVLANCATPGLCIQVNPRPVPLQNSSVSLQDAQLFLASSAPPPIALQRCGFGGCPTRGMRQELKTCPCKSVSYCQKSCQEAHWPEHKKSCSWQAKRKKERKDAGRS